MHGELPTIVVIGGSYLALWFLINSVVPIKRLGIKSRKMAFMFLLFDLVFVVAANGQRQAALPVNEQHADLAQPEKGVGTVPSKEGAKAVDAPKSSPKDEGQANILELAKDKEQQDIWIVKGQEAVQEKLKDPSSAQFRKSFFHLAKLNGDYAPISCGQVNSKNSLGGYIGFQRYISAGKPELTFLEEEVADFKQAWKMMCVD